MTLGRYWLGGPVVDHGKELWLVIDGNALPHNNLKVEKHRGTMEECERMIDQLNRGDNQ